MDGPVCDKCFCPLAYHDNNEACSMTSPATQEPCQKCGGRMTAEAVGEFRNWSECRECGHRWDYRKPPSQRAELLTQEQLRVHKACVEVVNHAPFRQDISELINAARALSDAYAALTQRVSTLTEAQVNAVCHAVCDQCVRIDEPDKPPCTTENCAAMRAAHEALAAYRALPKEPR